MHAAGNPEEVKRHVEPLKEFALLTPDVEFKRVQNENKSLRTYF